MAISKITSDAIDATDFNLDSNTFTIDSTNNRVGVGTTTVDSNAVLGINGRATFGDQATSGTTGAGSLLIGANAFYIQAGEHASSSNAADIRFTNIGGSAERMRVLSGGGITFNGDTAAANALDDYEEGIFTPTYEFSGGGGSFSYSIQVGYYTKVGRFVFAQIRIRGQKSGTGSGALQIAGLPFTVLNITNLFGTAAIGFTNNWNNRPMGAYIEANTTKVTLTKGASSSNTYSDLDTTVVNADSDTGSTSSNDLILTISYIT